MKLLFSYATLVPLGLLFILCVLLLAIYRIRKNSRFRDLISRLPQGPRRLPVVGNALDLLGGLDHVFNKIQVEWPQKYGEIFYSKIGSVSYVNISSPEFMEPILKSQKILDKGGDYKLGEPWLGDGLLLSTGAKWKSRRRLLTPAFHFQILNDFVDVFNKQSRILCQLFSERCDNGLPCPAIDVYPLITNCTLDIICEAAMNTEVHAQTQICNYASAIYKLNRIVTERISKPWLAIDFFFKLTALGRENNRALNTVHSFTDDVIKKRQEQLTKLNTLEEKPQSAFKSKAALLDLLLEAMKSDDGPALTAQDVREEIDTFMFEGHDTTATATAWFLYCIASNPQQQKRAYEELEIVFGDGGGSDWRDCTLQDLPNLNYLECCIKEALRLYPSVHFIERFAQEEFQVGEHLIPVGANIMILIYAMHHNPRIYPDPHTFRPERFFPDESVGRHPYAHVPFSAGPRNCIGQRFAMMEMKVVLSSLLRRFEFSFSSNLKTPVPSFQVVLKPLDGIELIVTPRY